MTKSILADAKRMADSVDINLPNTFYIDIPDSSEAAKPFGGYSTKRVAAGSLEEAQLILVRETGVAVKDQHYSAIMTALQL